MKPEMDYRLIVSQCDGAEYVGRRGDTIVFRDKSTDTILSLYTDALTPLNIFLALKASRERFLETHEWQQVNESERG